MESRPAGSDLVGDTLRGLDLSCVRGERAVFSSLDFVVSRGELLQVGGPNGSGKTSLLRMICGILQPASGQVQWNNCALHTLGDDYSRVLMYVGHLNGLKEELNVLENLHFAARLAGLAHEPASLAEALATFGFGAFDKLPVRFLSQGQKRRLALARLNLSKARLLWVLDEPFAALDAAGIEIARKVIEGHLATGGMVVMTTHQDVSIQAPKFQRIELAA